MYEFSKLQMVGTILSKRNLKWFVDQDLVEGWNDPRFPTVQGIMRRGMTVPALKDFMLEQGPSKNTNLQEWDKIWAVNKNHIDGICARYTCVKKDTACRITIENGPEPSTGQTEDLHPKNKDLGQKIVIRSKNIFIEKDDADLIVVGEKITLMKWGNVTI